MHVQLRALYLARDCLESGPRQTINLAYCPLNRRDNAERLHAPYASKPNVGELAIFNSRFSHKISVEADNTREQRV